MANTAKMCSYELPLATDGRVVLQTAARSKYASLPEPFLIRNVVWFCRFRWMVVTIFVLFGVLSLFPDLLLAKLGMRGYTAWPFITAAVLVLANIAFLSHARALMRSATSYGARVNLWIQIVLDLMVLTVVVHFVGSLDTFVPFAYLFHIVLACIFFSRPQSLLVTLIACAMYSACVWAERAGVIPLAGIHADALQQARIAGIAAMLNVASAVAI
ncbi:MAG: hypothetical protein QF662_04565, partial [Phycisphaerae bacterium]|nr:hypothetical protein [Phycisphaerae bacterium]